jgi:hypothetical protein
MRYFRKRSHIQGGVDVNLPSMARRGGAAAGASASPSCAGRTTHSRYNTTSRDL